MSGLSFEKLHNVELYFSSYIASPNPSRRLPQSLTKDEVNLLCEMMTEEQRAKWSQSIDQLLKRTV